MLSLAMRSQYLEIVTEDVEGVCEMYGQMHGASFGPPQAALGQARVAEQPDGDLIGVRSPLAEHEAPTLRAYLEVDDIEAAVRAAVTQGAMVAYPPTAQGGWGTFAIVIHAGVQHGLWKR